VVGGRAEYANTTKYLLHLLRNETCLECRNIVYVATAARLHISEFGEYLRSMKLFVLCSVFILHVVGGQLKRALEVAYEATLLGIRQYSSRLCQVYNRRLLFTLILPAFIETPYIHRDEWVVVDVYFFRSHHQQPIRHVRPLRLPKLNEFFLGESTLLVLRLKCGRLLRTSVFE